VIRLLLPARLRKSIKSVGKCALSIIDSLRTPRLHGREYIAGLENANVHSSCVLFVHRTQRVSESHIALGEGVYLGERVELEAAGKGIEIGRDTSLQHGCAVRGEVQIGDHCLFGQNVLIISSSHRFRDRPEWLIRDQDRAFAIASIDEPERPIRIEDDCWLGWGSAVMAGVIIGRGAVIGANCVVTRDIPPYEIHGGVPNRKIGERMAFVPPSRLDCMDDASLPYFYRGFFQEQAALAQSRARNVIGARSVACLVMSSCIAGQLQLRGTTTESHSRLHICINGHDHGVHDLPQGDFELGVQISAGSAKVEASKILRDFTQVELRLQTSGQAPIATYGITSATLTGT
jgi:acetyltransferase-like isoleucine patch superfamily enzyme